MTGSMFELPVRDDLVGVTAYGAPQLEVQVRLNVNENPYPPTAELADAIAESVRTAALGLNRYPDRDALDLRASLAGYLGAESGVSVDPAHVWAANGSNEVMHHLFLAFGGPGRLALTFGPTYSMYPEYARDTFTEFAVYPRNDAFEIDVARALPIIAERRAAMVIVTSPNNPTGTALPQPDLIALATAALAAGSMLIVDEAYAEFRREGTPSALELLGRFPNLVVSRTMSKAFGLAGARLGYAVAADFAVVDTLKVVRLPYHLSAVTQAVASTALRYADVLQAQVAVLRSERDALATWLAGSGFTVVESDANFIMFGIFDDRAGVWQRLLDRGVLIRQPEPEGWLRVSIGTPDENDRFRRALLEATASSD
ncbi:MAG: histidinol-phosphate transaminase [Actinobacteria bacterium]|uniref:Unannotated protein n=1 Tax=freshwater metagenome TaxID=449393 RepID=A0A6J7ETX5_9ZZZZ|nr:histidinol-phosphate transaminase [Actinomycetota bacterium]